MVRPGRPLRGDAKTAITKRINLTAKEDINYTALAHHRGVSFSDLVRSLLRETFVKEMAAERVKVPKK